MNPGLPMPVTTTRPGQVSTISAARANAPFSRPASCATASASVRITSRAYSTRSGLGAGLATLESLLREVAIVGAASYHVRGHRVTIT